ncbi:MAG TPA: DNA-deoxyinosine glycosylase [Methylophilaceae bacterium]|jgi:TDG/mug DNA glycosylase family protein
MSIVQSFPPVARLDARILILGSMPGKASLAANQYYAHPHNLFWPFMQQLLGIDRTADYQERLVTLHSHGIALWDVLKECFRTSSLDGDIVETSIIPNDFATFFAQHQQIHRIFFNGEKAEKAFRRYVFPGLPDMEGKLLTRLPSTSPANASISRAHKLQSWQAIAEK